MKKLTTISLFIFFAVVTAILTAGLVFYQNGKDSNNQGLLNQNKNTDIAQLASQGATILDLTEISKHNKSSDCWLLINGKVYDITSYFGKHPGGSGTMAATCGKDATDEYKTRDAYATSSGSKTSHSSQAVSLLANYYIGSLDQKISPSTNQNNINSTIQNNINTPKVDTNTISNTTNKTSSTTLTSSEVAKHNINSDCWIIVNSKVYNISNYASSHPGGTRNITNYCGKESTQAFDTKGNKGSPHSTSANQMLDQFLVGNLNQNVSQNTIDANIQKIKSNPVVTNGEDEYEDD